MDPGPAPTLAAADAGGEERKLAYRGWIGVRVELRLSYPETKLRPCCSLEKHFLLTFLATSAKGAHF